MLRYSSVSVRVPYPNCGSDTGIHMTRRNRPGNGRPRKTTDRVDRSIRLATLRNRRITACSLQMHYLGGDGRRVSVQTISNRLHASQLKSRKAAKKPLLRDGVTIEFIDDQSCLCAVAHYWHCEILANFCWTPPLFSSLGLFINLSIPEL